MLKTIKNFFALERNVAVIGLSNIIWGSGAWLWIDFLPKYFEVLGATAVIIGILFSLHSLLKSFFHAFAGHLIDIIGRKKIYFLSLIIGLVAVLIYFVSPSWIFLVFGILLMAVTDGMAQTSESTIITESLRKNKRATGRATTHIISMITAAAIFPIGGLIIQKLGLLQGVKFSLFITLITLTISIIFVRIFLKETLKKKIKTKYTININLNSVTKFLKKLPKPVKYFITANVLSLFAWSMANLYFIFYAFDVIGIQPIEWGILTSIELLSLGFFTFLGAKISDKYGRRYTILSSLLMFALIPLIYVNSHNFLQLSALYFSMGLLGLGFSSIEAYIADHTSAKIRGKTIGVSDSLLTASTIPGPFVGGILFSMSPTIPFITSTIIGLVGFLIAWRFLK